MAEVTSRLNSLLNKVWLADAITDHRVPPVRPLKPAAPGGFVKATESGKLLAGKVVVLTGNFCELVYYNSCWHILPNFFRILLIFYYNQPY